MDNFERSFIDGRKFIKKLYSNTMRENLRLEEENAVMREDINNLIDAYWYAIRTRECKVFPNEQENNEIYCKKLIEKYPH